MWKRSRKEARNETIAFANILIRADGFLKSRHVIRTLERAFRVLQHRGKVLRATLTV
jgi:hypothetical protein